MKGTTMATKEFNNAELTTIANAIANDIRSAQRQQKTGKTPQIVEVYRSHETHLKALEAKVLQLANKPE